MKKIYKKISKDWIYGIFKMSPLNFNFVIYTIHKMLVLLKNDMIYLKDGIFE